MFRRSLLCAVVIASALAGPVAAAPEAYRLGPEDRVRLKVTEWRAARGESYEWEALTGEFLIDAGGRLALPLLGEVTAGGMTTSELSSLIAETLQRRVGLVSRPDASVEVAQFRPFFVVGQVDKPGAYPYRPGLNVLQAVSLAGGLYRETPMGTQRLAREVINARGELRDLMIERSALLARRARLQAETRGDAAITFPEAVTERKMITAVADAMLEEGALFEARRIALRSQIDALTQAKLLIDAEISTLQEKAVSQDRQLALARKELDNINSLMQRGLAISPRQLALEQTVAQMESARLDIALAISRSRQDISRNDRTILDLRNQRQSTVLIELRETQTKLAKLQEKAETMRALLIDSEVTAPQAILARRNAERRPVTYALVRREADGVRESTASETETVQPGDVLKVEGPLLDEVPPRSQVGADTTSTVVGRGG
jgi:exopolysaccharide production protein ExoF